MKKGDLVFVSLLVPVDYLMLVCSGIFVYFLRFSALDQLRPVIYEIPFRQYLWSILIIALLWLAVFAGAGLYNLRSKKRFSRELPKVFIACSLGIMSVVLFIFFRGEYFSSRFIVLAAWLISFLFVSLGRILIHGAELIAYKKGKNLEPILILGQSSEAREMIQLLKNNPGFGYRVLGNPLNFSDLKENWSNRFREINQIIQFEPFAERSEMLSVVGLCQENQIIFRYVADVFGSLLSNIEVETLSGFPVITLNQTALQGWGRIAKRAFDLLVSALGLLLLWPLFLILAIIIKLDSPGSALVKLERVGQKNKHFMLYKFRSMVPNAAHLKKDLMSRNERSGPLFKMKNDPRITRFGKILRQTSLDELPQLLNIFKGEMSLVGPRPHEPQEISKYEREHKQLLTIKPGLTGLAQISGRSDLSFNKEAELDIYYIENWSLLLDLQIILMTVPIVLTKKNAV
ncbi:sugar transferase [Patescibacteria group bacterium]|nr:sugar transferase [Patescibacteria group bacterium]